jgi:hypothetical protein
MTNYRFLLDRDVSKTASLFPKKRTLTVISESASDRQIVEQAWRAPPEKSHELTYDPKPENQTTVKLNGSHLRGPLKRRGRTARWQRRDIPKSR